MFNSLKRLVGPQTSIRVVASAEAPVRPSDEPAEAPSEAHVQLRETFDLLEVDVTRLISDVIAAAGATHQDMSRFAKAVEEIFGSCGGLAGDAENAARDASALACATVELTSSSEEIGRRLRDASDLANGAKQTADETRANVDGLKASSADIMPIVGLISSIAKRTNLLALNATIEAAHAGAAGRGFAVVAGEVKSLAVETQKATDEIARRIADLQGESLRLIKAVDSIGQMIDGLSPVIAAISNAVEEQILTTAELSRSTCETSTFVKRVSNSAHAIAGIASATTDVSHYAEQSVQRVTVDAEKLRSRFVIFLRQTEIGSRRRHDRLPCERALNLSVDLAFHSGHTIDLSEGGALVAFPAGTAIAKGARVTVAIEGIGRTAARVIEQSKTGFHIEWLQPPLDFVVALQRVLEEIHKENADLVVNAIKAAESMSRAFEQAITSRRLTMETLFDAEYELIEGTNPPQYRTRALEVLEDILPPLQEPLLHGDSRIVFVVAVDRNAWLPVHNSRYSHPQRPNDVGWNNANCRNRRIFDERAGLAAARNVRPSLIQTYNRDLGGGNLVMMKEIDAPIRVFGRHWGGVRMAYNI
ncbi:MAG: methyl-accepting chemotaxis protein [Beijerinckiaceae bacterium]